MTGEKAVIVQPESSVVPMSESLAMLQVIERVAMNPQADIAKLQQMLDMQERVMNRNARMSFDAALAQMQPELPEVEKLAKGHNSMYAKFDKILTAIKPSLSKHGFSITHRVKIEGGLVHITGVLSHREGHREETTLILPPDDSGKKSPVQAIASSTEYGRRYTMNSLLGIATKDADVDGGSGEGEVELISEAQLADLLSAMLAKQINPQAACKTLRINKLDELQSVRFEAAMEMVKNTKGKTA